MTFAISVHNDSWVFPDPWWDIQRLGVAVISLKSTVKPDPNDPLRLSFKPTV